MENGIAHKRRRLDILTVKSQDAQASTSSRPNDQDVKPSVREAEAEAEAGETSESHPARLISLDRSISPPGRNTTVVPATSLETTSAAYVQSGKSCASIPSPIHLTRIRDLDASKNVDTVGLDDILGDPLIKECWQFNYLFDVDFLM